MRYSQWQCWHIIRIRHWFILIILMCIAVHIYFYWTKEKMIQNQCAFAHIIINLTKWPNTKLKYQEFSINIDSMQDYHIFDFMRLLHWIQSFNDISSAFMHSIWLPFFFSILSYIHIEIWKIEVTWQHLQLHRKKNKWQLCEYIYYSL